MSQPLVSVIIAVKNGARFLAAALDSVVAQEYRPLEILVVDGQSTDATAQIAQSYLAVRYLRQTRQGAADAYNVGLEAAQGAYLAFLSHDDWWTPDKLRRQVEFMQQHPDVQYTIAEARHFLEPGYALPPGFRAELLTQAVVAPVVETLVARKSLFAEIGGFDTSLTTADDVDWIARAQDRGVVRAVLPHVLLHKRLHDANNSLCSRANNHNLLSALRQSILRKRESQRKAECL